MQEFTKAVKAKGLTMKALGERWGINPNQMSNIAKSPKQIHWDALEGIEPKVAGMTDRELIQYTVDIYNEYLEG